MTERLGTIALLVDSDPPVMNRFHFLKRAHSRPLATFRVGDRLSDVDYQSLKAYIDGKFVVPEIDGEHHKVTVIAPEELTRGSHHLQVRVQDYMGNSTILERGFVVR
jgi:ribosomal protein L1